MNLHKYFMLSNKVLSLISLIIFSSLVILYLLSNAYLDEEALIIDSMMYREEYLANAKFFMEFLTVALVVVLMANFFNKENNNYQIFFIVDKKNKVKFMFTKFIFISKIIILMISIIYLCYLIIYKITPYYVETKLDLDLLLYLILNSLVYLAIAFLFQTIFKTELFSYTLFILFYIVKLASTTKYIKYLAYLVVAEKKGFLLYPSYYYLFIICFYFILSLLIFVRKDI